MKIKKFAQINEEDDFDVEELSDNNTQYLKTKHTYAINNLDKLLDRCLHDIDKEKLKNYIIEYIDSSTITTRPGGWGFYGADTEN